MKTLVIGASTKPERYSYKAVNSLLDHNHEVVPMSVKRGEIRGLKILNDKPPLEEIHTVTLYVSSKNQPEYYDYIINKIKPKRVIFNPGTENPEFEKKVKEAGIEATIACTLVLLSTDQF